jgi:hypothetical protein
MSYLCYELCPGTPIPTAVQDYLQKEGVEWVAMHSETERAEAIAAQSLLHALHSLSLNALRGEIVRFVRLENSAAIVRMTSQILTRREEKEKREKGEEFTRGISATCKPASTSLHVGAGRLYHAPGPPQPWGRAASESVCRVNISRDASCPPHVHVNRLEAMLPDETGALLPIQKSNNTKFCLSF